MTGYLDGKFRQPFLRADAGTRRRERKVAEAHAAVMRDVVMQEVVTRETLRLELSALERRMLLSTGSMLVAAVGFLSAMIAWF